MTNKTSKRKVLVIGLDGATFDIILPMIEKGLLPTLSRLVDTGAHGILKSTVPDLSPVAWTSMITGKNPGKHPIYDFITRQPGSYNFTSTKGGDRREQPIWSLLSKIGKKVGAINVTMSYPPEEVNGFIISGLDSPGLESAFTYPPSLHKEIIDKLGRYILVNPYALTTRKKHLQGMFEMIDNRLAATEYLMKRYDWDFMMAVFIATDGAQHFYWKDMDTSHPDHDPETPEPFKRAIFDVYKRLDEGIGKLLEKHNDKVTVMLVSDHGFQPLHKLFVLNNWLAEKGYLTLKKGISGSINLARWLSLGKKVKNKLLPGIRRNSKYNMTPAQPIDWEKTKAFADGTFGYIYINLEGREPHGIVNPGEEYNTLCDEITQALKEVRDPDNGRMVVEDVFRREKMFKGPYMEEAPDLTVLSRKNYFVSASSARLPGMHSKKSNSNSIFQKHIWSGNHEPNGIFIMNGPDIKRGHIIKGANIIDIAPTILHLFNQEIPDDMDGKVLLDAFSNEFRETNAPKFKEPDMSGRHDMNSKEFLPDEDEAVKERLRGLGYLE